MDRETYLPLGSVIIVKGSVKKILLIGRGVVSTANGKLQSYDYVGCTYPEGLVGETVLYIQHKDIEEVIFNGYQDEDDVRMQKNISEHMKQLFPESPEKS